MSSPRTWSSPSRTSPEDHPSSSPSTSPPERRRSGRRLRVLSLIHTTVRILLQSESYLDTDKRPNPTWIHTGDRTLLRYTHETETYLEAGIIDAINTLVSPRDSYTIPSLQFNQTKSVPLLDTFG